MTTNEHAGAPTGALHSTPYSTPAHPPGLLPEESPHYYQGRTPESVEASATAFGWAFFGALFLIACATIWAVVTR